MPLTMRQHDANLHQEENDYQTVAIARLQEILDAIGIKTIVSLSA